MWSTIRMAVDNGRKAIDGALENNGDNGRALSRKFAATIKDRINYGVAHALQRSGMTDLTPSQRKAYERSYHKGYMDAWSAGANRKNVLGRSGKTPRTIAEIGWKDGASQGSADVSIMSKGLI